MRARQIGIATAFLAAAHLASSLEPVPQNTPGPMRLFYRLESALLIPSETPPNWDYLTFDPSRNYLYIARREDGVLMYDAVAKKIVGAIANTRLGNATTLVPEFDRGYVTNTDGSLTTFEISTLKTLDRVKVGEDADNAFYDPFTKQLMVTMGESKQVVFVNAKTGGLIGRLAIDSERIEGSAPDGRGAMFTALRDRNKVLRIDTAARRVAAEWSPDSCEMPNGVAFDPISNRVFVSCRGEKPVLVVLDGDFGKVVARQTIGRGNDTVIFDAAARRIYTANGFDGTLVIIDQIDANTYKLREAVTTRPYARTMAMDFNTKKIYLVTAEGTVDPSKTWRSEVAPFYPNKYFEGTFTLLTYAPR